MRRSTAALGLALAACAAGQKRSGTAMTEDKPKSESPLLAPWQGPWGGVPPFGKFEVKDIKIAMEEAMARNLVEIDQIATNAGPATFDNTIVALERAGAPLDRASAVYGVYTSTMNDAEMQAIEADLSPKLAAFNDKNGQNATLFE